MSKNFSKVLGAALATTTAGAVAATALPAIHQHQHAEKASALTVDIQPMQNIAGVGFIGFGPSDGQYVYCLDKNSTQSNATYNAVSNNDVRGVSSIIAAGAMGPGKIGTVLQGDGVSDYDNYFITQMAVWRYLANLGDGNNDANSVGPGDPMGTLNTMWGEMNSAYRDKANQLIGQAGQKLQNVAGPSPDVVNNIRDNAQRALQQQLQDKVNQRLQASSTAASDSMNADEHSQQDASLGVLMDKMKSAASNAVSITPVAQQEDAKSKKAMPNWYDGDGAQGHVDNVATGQHEFHFQISHKDMPQIEGGTFTIPSSFEVKLDSALPTGTIIKQGGKVITSDASKSTTYTMGYDSYEVDVPFSDQPQSGANAAKAVAKAILNATTSFTVSGEVSGSVQSANISAAESMQANVPVPGGTTTTIVPTSAQGAQRLLMAVSANTSNASSSVSYSAAASGAQTVTTSIGPKGDQAIVPESAQYQFQWGKTLGSLAVKKTDEDGKPLKGVTFQLVQGSVTNSDVEEYQKSNKLADGDGQLISLPKATDANGNVNWNNLPFGEYTLLETTTNDGYKLSSDPTKITIDRNHVDVQNVTYTNSKGKTPSIKTPSHSAQPTTIKSVAKAANDQKKMLGANTQTLTDMVEYTNLQDPSAQYTLKGEVYDKTTGKTTGITANKDFQSDAADGQVSMDFQVDASKYAGKDLVVYETLVNKNTGSEVAKDADINNTDQTVSVTSPKIHTTATSNGAKTMNPDGTATITDAVSYEGLIPGQSYSLDGVAEDKLTVKPVDGQTKGHASFTASDSGSGTVNVNVTVDASKVGSKGITMFERLNDSNNNLVAKHEDINDEGQSVGKAVVNTPVLAKTAADHSTGIGAALIAAGSIVIAGSVIVYVKKNKA